MVRWSSWRLDVIGSNRILPTLAPSIAMIPAITLTPQEFFQKFHPGATEHVQLSDPEKPDGGQSCTHRSILNDMPTCATSFLIYNHDILKEHRGDCSFPIPQRDEFQHHRQLKVLRRSSRRSQMAIRSP